MKSKTASFILALSLLATATFHAQSPSPGANGTVAVVESLSGNSDQISIFFPGFIAPGTIISNAAGACPGAAGTFCLVMQHKIAECQQRRVQQCPKEADIAVLTDTVFGGGLPIFFVLSDDRAANTGAYLEWFDFRGLLPLPSGAPGPGIQSGAISLGSGTFAGPFDILVDSSSGDVYASAVNAGGNTIVTRVATRSATSTLTPSAVASYSTASVATNDTRSPFCTRMSIDPITNSILIPLRTRIDVVNPATMSLVFAFELSSLPALATQVGTFGPDWVGTNIETRMTILPSQNAFPSNAQTNCVFATVSDPASPTPFSSPSLMESKVIAFSAIPNAGTSAAVVGTGLGVAGAAVPTWGSVNNPATCQVVGSTCTGGPLLPVRYYTLAEGCNELAFTRTPAGDPAVALLLSDPQGPDQNGLAALVTLEIHGTLPIYSMATYGTFLGFGVFGDASIVEDGSGFTASFLARTGPTGTSDAVGILGIGLTNIGLASVTALPNGMRFAANEIDSPKNLPNSSIVSVTATAGASPKGLVHLDGSHFGIPTTAPGITYPHTGSPILTQISLTPTGATTSGLAAFNLPPATGLLSAFCVGGQLLDVAGAAVGPTSPFNFGLTPATLVPGALPTGTLAAAAFGGAPLVPIAVPPLLTPAGAALPFGPRTSAMVFNGPNLCPVLGGFLGAFSVLNLYPNVLGVPVTYVTVNPFASEIAVW